MKRILAALLFLLVSQPLFAAHVQVAWGATEAAGTSLDTSGHPFGSSVTSGHRITCGARLGTDVVSGDSNVFTFADSLGTKFHRVIGFSTSHVDPHMYIYDGIAPSTGADTVTMSDITPSVVFKWIYCVEHAYGDPAPAWNLPTRGNGTGSDLTTASMTTVETVDYLLCFGSQNNYATYTAGSGFSLVEGSIIGSTLGFGGVEEKFPNAALSAFTPHMTSSVGSTTAFTMVCVAFRTQIGALAVKRFRLYNFWGSLPAGTGDTAIAEGDAPNTEQARLFSSDDGLTGWVENYISVPVSYGNNYPIRNPAVITPQAATGGYWLMAHSETSVIDPTGGFMAECSHVGISRSTDGIHWTEFSRPSTSLFTTWAGNWFVDPSSPTTLHYLVGASVDNTFNLKEYDATSTDFGATWSSWAEVTGTAIPTGGGIWNDAQFLKLGSTYFMLLVKNGVEVQTFTSSSLTSGYTGHRNGDWTGQMTATVDTPMLYQIGGVWTLFWDNPGQTYYSQETAGDWTSSGSTTWGAKVAVNNAEGFHARAVNLIDWPTNKKGLLLRSIGKVETQIENLAYVLLDIGSLLNKVVGEINQAVGYLSDVNKELLEVRHIAEIQ